MTEEKREPDVLREFLSNLEENPFGVITQKGYRQLENKFNDHAAEIEARFHRWFLTGLVAFAIIALGTTVSLVGFGVLLTQQSQLTNEIQDQRYGAILGNCLDVNERHNQVIEQIDAAVAKTPESKVDKQGLAGFKAILAAAVPYTKNCAIFARRRVGGK